MHNKIMVSIVMRFFFTLFLQTNLINPLNIETKILVYDYIECLNSCNYKIVGGRKFGVAKHQ